jgi:tetratricopeptide (TPR) repeat protein
MAKKASIYQAQGNLQEAARFLAGISWQNPDGNTFQTKITQLRLGRNYGEAIHLLQTRIAQFRYFSDVDKGDDLAMLPLLQRLADDRAGASLTAKQARDTLEALCKSRPDDELRASLAVADAVMEEKDSALKAAEAATILYPTAKDRVNGPAREENLALVQTIVGENDRAISTLTRLLQTPYASSFYGLGPITPALLRLDPFWDSLRGDPAFQKLCEEKQP